MHEHSIAGSGPSGDGPSGFAASQEKSLPNPNIDPEGPSPDGPELAPIISSRIPARVDTGPPGIFLDGEKASQTPIKPLRPASNGIMLTQTAYPRIRR